MAKQFKPTPKYEFKHDGNRQQHNHQTDVKEALQTAFDALVNSNFDLAKEALEEGMLLVDERSKLIILADKYGWDFVQEYQRDEVASNSDDEKHIKKCLKLENSARVQKRAKVPRKLTPESTVGGVSSFMPHRSISVSPRSINPLLFRSSKQLFGPCHSCGRYGHYWRACPTRILQQQSPITHNSSQLRDRIPTMSAPFSTEPVQDFSDLANQFVARTCSHNCDYTCKRNYGVRDRLTASRQWWYDNLQLSELVMSVLVDGYVISFVEPTGCYLDNNASALNDSEFVVQAIYNSLA